MLNERERNLQERENRMNEYPYNRQVKIRFNFELYMVNLLFRKSKRSPITRQLLTISYSVTRSLINILAHVYTLYC